MKVLGYIFAVVLIILGAMFAMSASSTGIWQRWILGGALAGAGIAVMFVMRAKVPDQNISVQHTHEIDLTGDVSLEQMKCSSCGGPLDSKSVALQEGAIFVTCPHCNSSYQIEEAPKW